MVPRIKSIPIEKYVFWLTFCFYIFIWALNPNNKIFIMFFPILFIFYNLRLKNIRLSLLLLYLTTIIINVGKKYSFTLLPPGIFPTEIYPDGYVDTIAFSIRNIIVCLMFLLPISDLISRRIKAKFHPVDSLLIIYFIWSFYSDIFISKRPDISISFSFFSLESTFESLVVYFYIRIEAFRYKKIIKIILSIFIALVIFESVISFPQFLKSSPTGNNMESQQGLEYFGDVADEIAFRFRPLGTFPHANISGMWFSFMTTLLISIIIRFPNPYYIYSCFLGIIILIMTLSRGAWLGSVSSLLFILFFVEKIKRLKVKIPRIITKNIIGMTIIFIITSILFIFPRINKSIYFFSGGGGNLRNMQIKESLNLIYNNPLFGVGTKMSVQEGYNLNQKGIFGQVPLSPHIWYILTLVEHGIPAFVLFSLFMLISLKSVLKIITSSNLKSYYDYSRVGLTAAIISLLIIGFFQPFIGQPLILLSLALVQI